MGRGRGLSPQGTSLEAEMGRPWPGCSSSLLGLNRRFSERARPVILGYEQCHLALGSPATPLRRGVPETFGGLVGWEETKTIL